MRKMGGLWRKVPWTFATFLVGTLAIAGIPGLAGYYSKDEILEETLHAGKDGLFWMALFTAALTAFYMARLLFLTFFGHFRGDHETEHHVHESPWSMLAPLVILAAGCFVVGRIHVPEMLRAVVTAHGEEVAEAVPVAWLPYAASGLAVLAILAAYGLYVVSTALPGKIAAALRPLHQVLEAKWGFDDAFNWISARVVVDGSDLVLWKGVDGGVIDAAVNGTARLVDGFARSARLVQTGLIRAYALLILGGAVGLVSYMLLK